ncbi:MAG: CorA family divalent cation transporter [Anaerolineae bacterium]
MPQREVLNKLARDDFRVIDPRDRIFFRDIYDHLVRLHDLNESLRDLVGGVLDTYLSVVNNRMNEVMKTLTIITTLFMPITFITGFFGMNFFEPAAQLLGWTSQQAFMLMLSITACFRSSCTRGCTAEPGYSDNDCRWMRALSVSMVERSFPSKILPLTTTPA